MHGTARYAAAQPPRAEAGLPPPNGLCARIDRAVMRCFTSSVLEYRGDAGDLVRLPLRVTRNLAVLAYTPLRMTGLLLSAPSSSFRLLPDLLIRLARSLLSLEALIMVLASHTSLALTVSLGLGSSLPLSAFYAVAIALIALRGVGEMSGRAAVGRALLLSFESLATGWILGRALTWWMQRQFAPKIAALRQQAAQSYQLPPASREFVNARGEALLLFSGERAQEFFAQNPELATDFAARYHQAFSRHPGAPPTFCFSQVVVGGEQGVTVTGGFSWANEQTSWAMAHLLPAGRQVSFPCLNAQQETLRVWEGSLALLPVWAESAPRRSQS
jgi:hypothetical protein